MQIVKDLSQNRKGRYRILQLSNDYRTGLNGGLAYKRPDYKFKQNAKNPSNKRTPVYGVVQEEPPVATPEDVQSVVDQAPPIITEYQDYARYTMSQESNRNTKGTETNVSRLRNVDPNLFELGNPQSFSSTFYNQNMMHQKKISQMPLIHKNNHPKLSKLEAKEKQYCENMTKTFQKIPAANIPVQKSVLQKVLCKRKSSNNVYNSNGLSIKDFNPGMDETKATNTTKAYRGDFNNNV